jgi:hypothetical protein
MTMNAPTINALGALAAGLLAVLAAPATAQVSTTANGPYYATPSWDQKLTTNRFVVLANWNGEAALDRETGLVWQVTPGIGSPYGSDSNWYGATLNCVGVGTGGRYGWRLPTYHEISSLADASGALPAGHPFQVGSRQLFWSTTIYPGNASLAFVRNIVAPTLLFDDRVAASANVWCVRGGQGVNSNW